MKTRSTVAFLREHRGSAIIFVAVALVVLFGFVGLAIDVGYFYVIRGELQNAADSGALAGAQVLYDDPTSPTPGGSLVLRSARARTHCVGLRHPALQREGHGHGREHRARALEFCHQGVHAEQLHWTRCPSGMSRRRNWTPWTARTAGLYSSMPSGWLRRGRDAGEICLRPSLHRSSEANRVK